jgi:hypothetical protein
MVEPSELQITFFLKSNSKRLKDALARYSLDKTPSPLNPETVLEF